MDGKHVLVFLQNDVTLGGCNIRNTADLSRHLFPDTGQFCDIQRTADHSDFDYGVILYFK